MSYPHSETFSGGATVHLLSEAYAEISWPSGGRSGVSTPQGGPWTNLSEQAAYVYEFACRPRDAEPRRSVGFQIEEDLLNTEEGINAYMISRMAGNVQHDPPIRIQVSIDSQCDENKRNTLLTEREEADA